MIFVTVGTHEQQFNRLVSEIDSLKKQNIIIDDVIIQTGYCTYEPKYCKWSKLYPYEEMVELVEQADIVITHGGPSSFIMPLQIGKIPIVVPRQKQYNEHVNNHQLEFCKAVSERMGNIILVENVDVLKDTILNYKKIVSSMNVSNKSNNVRFNEKFKILVDKLLSGGK